MLNILEKLFGVVFWRKKNCFVVLFLYNFFVEKFFKDVYSIDNIIIVCMKLRSFFFYFSKFYCYIEF